MDIGSIQGGREDISRMLQKIREMSGNVEPKTSVDKAKPSEFNSLLAQSVKAIDKVNELQSVSSDLKDAYIRGDENVKLSQVVLASQQSKIAFHALLNVRNKVIEAYRAVMNMPI